MSTAEIVGLALTALFAGIIVGAMLSFGFAGRRRRQAIEETRRKALLEWLSARKQLSRSYLSFVAAQRAFASEAEDSPRFDFRCEETLRARSELSDAQRRLDEAVTQLTGAFDDPLVGQRLHELSQPPADEVRGAVNGTTQDVERLARALAEVNGRSEAFTLHERNRIPQSIPKRLIRSLTTWSGGILDRLASPPT